MALAEMCKARIAVHKSVADELVEKLQGLGCCEFISQTGSIPDGGAILALRSKQRHIEELLSDARFVTRLLEPFEVNKESSLGRMLGDIPQITLSELALKVDEDKFTSFVATLRDTERRMTECRADLSRLKGLMAQAILLESVKYPLEFFTTGTSSVIGTIYSVPKASSDEMASRLKSDIGDLAEFQQLPSGEKEPTVSFAVLCAKESSDKLQEIAAELMAGRVDVPKDFTLTASEERERLSAAIASAEKEEASLCAEITSCADEGLYMARYYNDYLTILRDRAESMVSGVPTEDVFIWSFWMPKASESKVREALLPYEALMEYSLVEPDEGETVPTLLKNGVGSSCMEPLTLMYGTPTYGGVDPTALMAPFFFMFMGMCFGDAGYGLVLSGVFGYFLVRHKLPSTTKKFFVMLTVGMVCSVIMGALTGSWFGDSVDAFPFLASLVPLKNAMQFLDPMNDPMTLLFISLGLGFIQIIFGLLIAFRSNWKSGAKFAAFADQGGWIIILAGLLLVGLSLSGTLPSCTVLPSQIIAALGALILVATQGREKTSIAGKIFSGVLSLYNVTGYLGDVLSYSRLLALGLGSAAVGMVINLLAKLVVGTPYIGILLAILIFIIGHTFSIMVNLLGAFIHPLRLQYVEFFGKFYDANGKDFTPLCNAVQYAKLTEDPSAR